LKKKSEIQSIRKRIADIDTFIQNLYEKNISGELTNERFATLSLSYEREQKELKDKLPVLEETLKSEQDKSEGLQTFIKKVKAVTEVHELTAEIVNEFIDKIVVFQPEKINVKRHQRIDIYYQGVGIVHIPDPIETINSIPALIKKK